MRGLFGFAGMGCCGGARGVGIGDVATDTSYVDSLAKIRALNQQARLSASAGDKNTAAGLLANAESTAAAAGLSDQFADDFAFTQSMISGTPVVNQETGAAEDPLASYQASRNRVAVVQGQVAAGGMFTNPQEACVTSRYGFASNLIPSSLYGKLCDQNGNPTGSLFDLIPSWVKWAAGITAGLVVVMKFK